MSGLTPQEQAVMDLWDGGADFATIAARLELSVRKTRSIVGTYHDGGEENRERLAMQQSSSNLLDALRRTAA